VLPERWADIERLAAVLTSAGHDVRREGERLVVRRDVLTGAEVAASVNRTAHSAGIVVIQLTPVQRTLEERFLALTAGAPR
jgi:hypothetical protein